MINIIQVLNLHPCMHALAIVQFTPHYVDSHYVSVQLTAISTIGFYHPVCVHCMCNNHSAIGVTYRLFKKNHTSASGLIF